MAKMISPPNSSATGIGALPHTDPREACEDVLTIFPEFPYIPTLPDRSQLESIVFNDSEQLPGRVIRNDRLLFDSSRDQTAAMEKVYLDFVEGNFADYGLHAEYASAFIEMMTRKIPHAKVLKCQVTGPVTFGMQVVDADKRPIYYDAQIADVLSKMIALKARWCENEMKTRTGVPETLVVLNEPYLASLGSSVVPVDRDTVRAGWADISSMVEGGLGIHCCSNTDWEFVMSLNPSVISLDAYSTAREFLLYSDAVISYMERGGVVAWGIVPSDSRVFFSETPESLFEKYLAIRSSLCNRMPESLFDSRSMITPSCGIRFADREGSIAIMRTAARISQRIREKSGSGVIMPVKPFTIALSGKGGTGKTTISSLLIRSLIDLGEAPVLAVDADPNANLHEALGVTVDESLGSMREEAFTRHIPPGMNRHDYVRFRFRQALVESEGFDLIAMGRPEGSGCYCFANDLLSECMLELERDYHFIVIDTEAGMEHIARGTIGKPDLLLIVSDPGARSLRTIARIREIATQIGLERDKIQVVFNQYGSITAPVDAGTELPIALIPDDRAVKDADLQATPVSLIPRDSPARTAVRDLAEKIREMAKKRQI